VNAFVTHMEIENRKPVVIILAAGLSTRFRASGPDINKLDAPLGAMRVRDHVLASGLPWHMVDLEKTAHLAEPGMGWSIACGVAATPDAAGWLILPSDLPLIKSKTLQDVAFALEQNKVVVPVYLGHAGHPIGFSRDCREALLLLQGDQGARSVVRAHQSLRLMVDDPGCVLDVDTWGALKLAQTLIDEQLTTTPSVPR
jgi:molybdenum cofactor cytidylyltransferase